MKSAHIRSYSGPHFPAFKLNKERYYVFSWNAEKYGPAQLRIQTLFAQCMFKVSSRQLGGTLTATLERHFTVEDFTEMDQHRW